MRCLTGTQAKSRKKNGGHATQQMPREGTKLRAVYDTFQANKGEAVRFTPRADHARAIVDLTDYYGLDIRRIRNGSSRVGRESLYVLAGEWFGRVYVDYVAERMHAATKPQPEARA